MSNKDYLTISRNDCVEVSIQKSRFITSGLRVDNEDSAQKFIHQIKSKYWNANHNCFGYIIGNNAILQKCSDDGEPSGTAGFPILDVLKKRQLCNVLIVVTRYFGGIKLGKGGLIRAYQQSTSEALAKCGISQLKYVYLVSVTVDHTLYGKLENQLRQSVYKIKETLFQEQVTVIIYVPECQITDCAASIDQITDGQNSFKKLDRVYLEVPLTHDN